MKPPRSNLKPEKDRQEIFIAELFEGSFSDSRGEEAISAAI
jgi:hypothetical protein